MFRIKNSAFNVFLTFRIINKKRKRLFFFSTMKYKFALIKPKPTIIIGRMSRRGPGNSPSGDETVIRIPPHFYIHVLDLKTNVTKTIIGPDTFVRQVRHSHSV